MKKCKNYIEARRERQNELEKMGFVWKNTLKYHSMGCYECIGSNFDCKNYIGGEIEDEGRGLSKISVSL